MRVEVKEIKVPSALLGLWIVGLNRLERADGYRFDIQGVAL